MSESTMGNGVPAPPAPFVGRKVELDYLAHAVRPGRIVALSGQGDSGGVGKTALAQAFAQTSERFSGTVWWSVPLDGDVPHLALRRWAMRGGLAVDGLATMPALLEAVSGVFATRGELLVVLDGVAAQHLPTVRAIVAALPASAAVLVTAEDPDVAALLGARDVVVEPLDDEEGHALLRAVVGSEVPPVIAGALLAGVAFRPLGIRMAGARLKMMQSDESTGMWGGKVDPQLLTLLGGPPSMGRTLLDVYRRVDDDTQATFRALGVFVHGLVRAESLAHVLACSTSEARRLVEAVAGFGLAEAQGTGQWQVHALVRRYAYTLLEHGGDAELLVRRRLSAVVSAAGAATAEVDPVGVLDVIQQTLERGDADDAVALATRASEHVGAWCLESAQTLVARALVLARADGHRAANMLQGRLDQFEARAADEVREDDDLDLMESGSEAPALEDPEALYEPVAYDDDDSWWMGDPDGGDAGETAWDVAPEEAYANAEEPASMPQPEPAAPPAAPAVSAMEAVESDPDQDATHMLAREQLMEAIMAARAEEQAREAEDHGAVADLDDPAVVAFVTQHDLMIDDGDSGEAFLEADGGDRGGIFGIGRMVSKLRGDDASVAVPGDRARAAGAASACFDMYERSMELVAGGVRDAGEEPDHDVDQALVGLANAVKKVREHTLAARTASERAGTSEDAEEVRALAQSAERHQELCGRSLVVVEATWSGLQDTLVDAVETRALRAASIHRARRDLALARQHVEDGVRRAEVRGANLAEDDVDTRVAIEGKLSQAREALAALEEAVSQMELGTRDLEDGAAEVERLRAQAESAAQQAIELAGNQARAVREEERRAEAIEESREHYDRMVQDAGFAQGLCDESQQILGRHDDPEARELRGRLRVVIRDLAKHRGDGALAFSELSEADASAWQQYQATVSASARGVAVCLAEVERLRNELDAWSSALGAEDATLVLAALHAEAATAEASLEATTAVARHASSRAHQAASHARDVDLSRPLLALKEAESQLRDVRMAARRALREIVQTQDAAIARDRWNLAKTALDMAQEVSDEARGHAEELLQLADQARREQLEALVAEGRMAGRQIETTLGQIAQQVASTREAADELGVRPPSDLQALVGRGEAAREAVQDGLQRLARVREPGLAARIVEALVDAADVVGAGLMEATTLRHAMEDRLAARHDPHARRAAAEEAMEEAQAAVRSATVDVDDVWEAAGDRFRAIVGVALAESGRDIDRAKLLVEDAPAFTGEPQDWFVIAEEVEGRADAVIRMAERIRQGALAAHRLVDTALARKADRDATARAEVDERLQQVRAAVADVVDTMADEVQIDDLWPAPMVSVAVAANDARDGVLGAKVAVDGLGAGSPPYDVDALAKAGTASQRRAVAQGERQTRRLGDLEMSMAAWREHALGRRMAGGAYVAAAVQHTMAGLEGFDAAADALTSGAALVDTARQLAEGDGDEQALRELQSTWTSWRIEASMAAMLVEDARQAALDEQTDRAEAAVDQARQAAEGARAVVAGLPGDAVSGYLVELDALWSQVVAHGEQAAGAADQGVSVATRAADDAEEARDRVVALADRAADVRKQARLASAPNASAVAQAAVAAQSVVARVSSDQIPPSRREAWAQARHVVSAARKALAAHAEGTEAHAVASHALVASSEVLRQIGATRTLPPSVPPVPAARAVERAPVDPAWAELSSLRRTADRWVLGWTDAEVLAAHSAVIAAADAAFAEASSGDGGGPVLAGVQAEMVALETALGARHAVLTKARRATDGVLGRRVQAARLAGSPAARVEAAMAAVDAADGQPDLRAALLVRAAQAWLALGKPSRARGCVDAALACAVDGEVQGVARAALALVDRAEAEGLVQRAAPDAWAASKDARRIARRIA